MTIQETAKKFGIKEYTVLDWCNKQLIRGLTRDEFGSFVIPNSVKKPYTKNRSKGDAIYTSIVKATLDGFDVTASLYGLGEQEFEKYIQQLKEAEVIDSYIDNSSGVEYLCRTLKSNEFAKLPKNRIIAFLKCLKPNINTNIGVNKL